MTEVTETIKDVLRYTVNSSQKEFKPVAGQAVAGEQPRIDEGAESQESDLYADMPHWELLLKIQKGEITNPAAATAYLQKLKDYEMSMERGYAERNPNKSAFPLETAIEDIGAKYDPLITGTDQERACYFAQEATSMLNSYHTGEMKVKSNQRAGNMFTYASILAKQGGSAAGQIIEKPPTDRIEAVRTELAQVQTRKAV